MIGLLTLAGIFVIILADRVSERFQACLNQIPVVVLRLAARRLGEEVRSDYLDEWLADCNYRWLRLRATHKIPFVYLVGAIRDAFTVFVNAREIDDCIGGSKQQRSPKLRFQDVRVLTFSGGMAIGGFVGLTGYALVDQWTGNSVVSTVFAWVTGALSCMGYWVSHKYLVKAFFGMGALMLTWVALSSVAITIAGVFNAQGGVATKVFSYAFYPTALLVWILLWATLITALHPSSRRSINWALVAGFAGVLCAYDAIPWNIRLFSMYFSYMDFSAPPAAVYLLGCVSGVVTGVTIWILISRRFVARPIRGVAGAILGLLSSVMFSVTSCVLASSATSASSSICEAPWILKSGDSFSVYANCYSMPMNSTWAGASGLVFGVVGLAVGYGSCRGRLTGSKGRSFVHVCIGAVLGMTSAYVISAGTAWTVIVPIEVSALLAAIGAVAAAVHGKLGRRHLGNRARYVIQPTRREPLPSAVDSH